MRKTLAFIHLWLGLVLLIPGLSLGITGAALVFADEIDFALHRDLYRATGRPATITLDRVAALARQRHPMSPVEYVDISSRRDRAHRVAFADGMDVFVDAGIAQINGTRNRDATLVHWLTRFHTEWLVNGLDVWLAVASFLVVLAAALGLYLWLPPRKQWRYALMPNLRGPLSTRLMALHRVVGFYALVPVLLMALTGGLLTFPAVAEWVLYRSVGETPPVFQVGVARSGPAAIGLDAAVRIAAARVPDALPVVVAPPQFAGDTYRVQSRRASEPYLRGATYIYIDPENGAVASLIDPDNMSVGARLDSWILAMHTGFWGRYFGEAGAMVSRVLWFASSLTLAALALTGAWTWLSRSRRQRQRRGLRQASGHA
jgi:uncharacterized iron-regulated membrane protein